MATKIICDSCTQEICLPESKAMIDVEIIIRHRNVNPDISIAKQNVDLCTHCSQQVLKYLDFKSKPRTSPKDDIITNDVRRAC